MTRNLRSKLSAVSLVGVLGMTLFAGGYKRHSEQSMPIHKNQQECVRSIESASNLQIREIPFCFGKTYNLVSNNERVGTIYERIFNWGNRFDFYAGTKENGRYLGYAQEKVFSIGHQSTVYDEHDGVIGKLDEKILKLNPGHLIEVFDSKGGKVAISDEEVMHFTHTTKIYNGNKTRVLGGTTKDFFWDNYTLNINNSDMDNRLFLALMVMEDKLDDESSSSKSNDDD